MPQRINPPVSGEIYHVINRGVASMPIFTTDRDYQRALETIIYYQNQKPPIRYSYFSRLPKTARLELLNKLHQSENYLVEIIAYCLMPNHIHLLLKQISDNGITNFMRKLFSSYTHYFNIKNKRLGPLFQGRFKSVRIESEQQLLHVSRYIHLNPYSSGVIKSKIDLKQYLYSSFPEYLGLIKNSFCQKDIILDYFKQPGAYQNFIYDQADYQRELAIIKHLILEIE